MSMANSPLASSWMDAYVRLYIWAPVLDEAAKL